MILTSTVSRPVKIGLHLTGVWPNSSVLFKLLWTSVMGTMLTFQYNYILNHFNSNDLSNLIDGLSTTLPFSLLFFKLVVLWINNRVFIDILMAMSKDWREYSSMYTMIDKAVLSNRCSKLIIGIYATAVLLYSTASIDLKENVGSDCRELLIKMELPFVFCDSPIYEIIMFMQFIHLMAGVLAISVIDALIVTLMLHIGGQIDIIHHQLSAICKKDGEYSLSTTVARSLISKHHKIIAFSDSIEKLFSNIALMQFLTNTMIMCCIGFLVVTTLGTVDAIRIMIKSLFFYISVTMESFIFCFAGEYLNNKSKTVGDAAYESFWYVLKPQDSRILLLMIMRSQRGQTITAGKFMDLSLQGFTNSMKASASYISVLYAMY